MLARPTFAILFSLLALFADPARSQDATFKLGIAPHTSARVILEMYQPLRQHLESTLGLPVEVQTAPDFTEFGRRALNQEYDLAVTTGHQARLYQTEAGYLPLLTYKADFKAVALVARQSKYRKAADLRGTTGLGLSRSSLVTLWGQHWLKINDLNDVTLRYISAADSVSRQVLAGDAAVAFTSLANYQKLPAEQQAALRILAESEPMAGRVYVLNRQRSSQQGKIDAALWTFAETAEGKKYFEDNKLGGYRKLRPKELEAMEPYAAETLLQIKGK
ncbi:phosphate ABC transporter substrate-binding protein [Dechloromonas denitrificans]|uniref:Phosphate ABC transporter substrate-binding protein n=1 Tax=Dechloromonas denitrificans TaxID=281362 RepID=A0A133XFN6_9RHOO|nr:phosphate/phosphite/phosphonate ABC transporter substrate-binding protein [Dechloromonas denitrificans]KXB29716.1 phosphate ABC transporter substrate-binding protein [Dechloromonas denitrificans]